MGWTRAFHDIDLDKVRALSVTDIEGIDKNMLEKSIDSLRKDVLQSMVDACCITGDEKLFADYFQLDRCDFYDNTFSLDGYLKCNVQKFAEQCGLNDADYVAKLKSDLINITQEHVLRSELSRLVEKSKEIKTKTRRKITVKEKEETVSKLNVLLERLKKERVTTRRGARTPKSE